MQKGLPANKSFSLGLPQRVQGSGEGFESPLTQANESAQFRQYNYGQA